MTKLKMNDNILGSVKILKRKGKGVLPILNVSKTGMDRGKELLRRSQHYLDDIKFNQSNLKPVPSDKVLHCMSRTDKVTKRMKGNPYEESLDVQGHFATLQVKQRDKDLLNFKSNSTKNPDERYHSLKPVEIMREASLESQDFLSNEHQKSPKYFKVGKSHTLLESWTNDKYDKMETKQLDKGKFNPSRPRDSSKQEYQKISQNTDATLRYMMEMGFSTNNIEKIRMTIAQEKPHRNQSVEKMNPKTNERKSYFTMNQMIKQNKKRKANLEEQMYK